MNCLKLISGPRAKWLNMYIKLTCLASLLMAQGCTDGFLDVKPDRSMVLPNSLDDLEALLASDGEMNSRYPSIGMVASDNLYVTPNVWESLSSPTVKSAYVWGDDLFNEGNGDGNDWSYPYITVFYANVVLENLEEITPKVGATSAWEMVKGEALFFRAYAFYHLAQVFAQPYRAISAEKDLGIALRLSPDPNLVSERASVKQTYERILRDAKQSVRLLPERPEFVNRPSKPAAYGLLARVYLSKGDYAKAGSFADSCLMLQGVLLDYNTLDTTSGDPIPPFNDEVVFHSLMAINTGFFSRGRYRVDTSLLGYYAPHDLRRKMFFTEAEGGGHLFSGNYGEGSTLFNGITSAEMYLVKAECEARLGDLESACHYLNRLLEKRYQQGLFHPVEVGSKETVLDRVLLERRKELAFRGLRWADLRRLNLDPRHAKTLKRELAGNGYSLPPNDPRYTFPLPNKVVEMSGMAQTPR